MEESRCALSAFRLPWDGGYDGGGSNAIRYSSPIPNSTP